MTDWLDKLKADALAASLEGIDDRLEPVAGDKIVGDLTEVEQQSYIRLVVAENRFEEIKTEFVRRHLERSFDNVIENFDKISTGDIIALGQDTKFFLDDEEATEFFKAMASFEAAMTQFWFNLRVRLDVWSQSLSIRKNWRVVTTGYKYHR